MGGTMTNGWHDPGSGARGVRPPAVDPVERPIGGPAQGAHGRRLRRGVGVAARAAGAGLETAFGGPARTRVIVLLACVLALASADTATVGASASELNRALHIDNADIGLLVAVTALVAAVASLPFGILVDRFNRLALLGGTVVLWGGAMLASAVVSTFGQLLVVRLVLGFVTAAAGPAVASLVGDYFPSSERGKIYGYVLAGELVGAGVGFVITGDIAAISWRVAFGILSVPAFILAWLLRTLREPARGGASALSPGATRIMGRKEAAQEAPTQVLGASGDIETSPYEATDAQLVAQERGIAPDPELILRGDPRRMGVVRAVRYVLRVRTNVVLIASSACAYFFLTGVQTFGLEFATGHFHVSTFVASLLMLMVGGGAVAGVLSGGRVGDALVRRRHINGRITVAGVAALATCVLFIPALTTSSAVTALPYVAAAGFFLTAQNPPLDAARLDILPPLLWGRAEGVRTLLRTGAQALAPLVFGGLSSLLSGPHNNGLQVTFLVMLLPLAASGVILLRGTRHYPVDVATAAASLAVEPVEPPVTESPIRRRRRRSRRFP